MNDTPDTPARGRNGASSTHGPPAIDTTVAHPARVWDHWLGGKDNYLADRELGDQILEAMPD